MEQKIPLDRKSYELLHTISKAHGSAIYTARCVTTGQLVCIKTLEINSLKFDVEKFKKKVENWRIAHHYNLVKYYGMFLDEYVLWMIMEYIDGGTILDALDFSFQSGFKDEILIASILREVLLFLDFWHENHHTHGDIRPATIYISNSGQVKVGALGSDKKLIVKKENSELRSSLQESIFYMSPEVLSGKPFSSCSDIWSLGITAIELATGSNPFSEFTPAEAAEKIVNDIPLDFGHEKTLSSTFCTFVKNCLKKQPEKRPTAKELLHCTFIEKYKGEKFIYLALMTDLPPIQQRYAINHQEEIEIGSKPQSSNGSEQESLKNEKVINEQDPKDEKHKSVTVEHIGRFTVTSKRTNSMH